MGKQLGSEKLNSSKTIPGRIYKEVDYYLNSCERMKNEIDLLYMIGGIVQQENIRKNLNSQLGELIYASSLNLEIVRDINILDVCCGPGVVTNYSTLSINNFFMTGIDINPVFIDYCKEKFKDKRYNFICEDIFEYDCDKSYDIVIANSGYHHIQDRLKVSFLEKLKSLVSKQGVIIISDNFLPPYKFEKERLDSVNLYYDSLQQYLLQNEANEETIWALNEIRTLELEHKEEYKVDFQRFKSHVEYSGLKFGSIIQVWQVESVRTPAGSLLVTLKPASA